MTRFLRTRQFPGYADYDMNRVALRKSHALIVHNGYMRRRLEATLAERRLRTPIHEVPLAVPLAPSNTKMTDVSTLRRELNLAPDAFVVGSFGVIHESKRLSVALDAFSRLLHDVPNSVYLLVGPPHSQDEVRAVESRGLGDHVRLTGHVEISDFYRYVAASDLCLNLRYPSTGGTSSALIRLMSVGRPVVVTNHAQFAELPDDVCLKLDIGRDEVPCLHQLMLRCAQDGHTYQQIGARARDYVEQHHTPGRAALAYKDAILAVSASQRPRRPA